MNAFSAAPDSPGLKILWGDGWVEDFPEDEFAEECEDRPRCILMYRKRSKCPVEYTLSVRGAEAFLDYGGRFREANTAPDRDLYIGTTRIRFTDDSRTVVRDVAWRDEGTKTFRDYEIRASWAADLSHAPTFSPPANDHRQRRLLSSVLRPGQLRFRRTLLLTYGGSCCMTGSTIEETLEAAHIMPYRGTQFDHPENGLLLRADLHRLFDRLHISINPDTFSIVLAPTLKEHPEYSALADRRLLIPSRSTKPAYAALMDHWVRFKKTQQGAPSDAKKLRA